MLQVKVVALSFTIFTVMAAGVMGQDAAKPAAEATPAPASTNAAPSMDGAAAKPTGRKHQSDVASATAEFGTVAATDDVYKNALDAHALADALKMVDKEGAFKGKVTKVFEPRGLAILNFDENYKSAMTAVVHGTNFTNFPALTNLVGKDVLVTGKFINYHEAAEIVVDKPEQIKVVK